MAEGAGEGSAWRKGGSGALSHSLRLFEGRVQPGGDHGQEKRKQSQAVPGRVQVDCCEQFLHGKVCPALAQAGQGRGGVPIPGGV